LDPKFATANDALLTKKLNDSKIPNHPRGAGGGGISGSRKDGCSKEYEKPSSMAARTGRL
jgi:hypothetical protein